MECESCGKDIEHLEDEGCEYVYVYCSECHDKFLNKTSSLEWISVKDKLPEKERDLIICTRWKGQLKDPNEKVYYLYSAHYRKEEYFDVYEGYNDEYEEITHWMYKDDFPFPDKDK